LKYSNQENPGWYGKNLQLYAGDGTLLCTDTIRCWFDWPHYKTWIEDDEHTSNSNSTNNRGGAGDWYCYRLAETYLLRAEAKFYKGDIPGATADVNKIRERAGCTQLYSSVTIGDIMDERARELWMEEWRFTELSRVSYCLALSGQADEWGNTYPVGNLSENSYWFQRIEHYNNYYNKGGVTVKNRYFTMAAHNIYWPIPRSAIDANRDGQLRQNPGYDGYDPGIPMWETWQEAVADEETTSR
ncbi:MAG: RagB/SusD family nutrient uptake outer membrane protein, partial [Mangrovibacterium sp.]